MRASRLVRLIGVSLLAAAFSLLAVPFAHAVTDPGAPLSTPRFMGCDPGFAGSSTIPNGHSHETTYCVKDTTDRQAVMNKICTLHGSSYSPPGNYVSTITSNAYFPGGIATWYIDCAGAGAGNKQGAWYRQCPSTTVYGQYESVWKHHNVAGAVACPPGAPKPDDCAAKEGTPATGNGYFSIGNSPEGLPTVTTCKDSCTAIFQGDSPAGRRLNNGVYEYYAEGQYVFGGGQCESGDAPASPLGAVPADTCPAGKVLTTKPDGKKACVDPTTDEEQDPNQDDKCPAWCGCGTKTTNNSDGSVDSVVTTWENSGGGYACVKKSYHDPDGAGPAPGGPGSGSPPTEQEEEKPDEDGDGNPDPAPDPMDDFCKKNPKHEMCSSGSFGGSCSGGSGTFTCEGDAVECAIARATNELNCAFKPSSTTTADILEASGLTGKETALKSSLTATEHDISSMLKLNERDLSGACPAPISGTVMGASFDVDLSPLCDLAEILGALLMISAALVSARIIGGGV